MYRSLVCICKCILHEDIHTPKHLRSKYHTQLAKLSFDQKHLLVDLTAEVYSFILYIYICWVAKPSCTHAYYAVSLCQQQFPVRWTLSDIMRPFNAISNTYMRLSFLCCYSKILPKMHPPRRFKFCTPTSRSLCLCCSISPRIHEKGELCIQGKLQKENTRMPT